MSQMTWEGPIPTSGRQRRGVLAPVVGMVALGICGLIVLGLVASSIGVGGVVVGALCALLPVAPVVASFLWVDRWEPEPPRLLLLAFLWGAGFAALSALVINSSAALVADEVLGRGSGDVVGAVAVAPIVEEAVKGAFLVGLLIFRRREFDGIVDGIVYAGLVAAGFAFTENILYIGRAFTEVDGQVGGVFGVLVLRGILSPFAHPLFTAMTGIGAGIASNSRNPFVRVTAVLIGYALAVTLHALWNGSASVGGSAFLGVYAFIMVPLFLAMIAVVVWQRRREQRIVIDQLPGFAQAGWIAPSEITLLSSLAGRRGWRAAVRRRSGKKVEKAVTNYQAAVTDLAFLRSRMARGSVGETGRFWHDQALAELVKARSRAVGHPEALTMAVRVHGPSSWTPPASTPLPAGPGAQHYPRPPQQGSPQQGSPQHGSSQQGSPLSRPNQQPSGASPFAGPQAAHQVRPPSGQAPPVPSGPVAPGPPTPGSPPRRSAWEPPRGGDARSNPVDEPTRRFAAPTPSGRRPDRPSLGGQQPGEDQPGSAVQSAAAATSGPSPSQQPQPSPDDTPRRRRELDDESPTTRFSP